MTRGNLSRAAKRDNVLILYAWKDKGSSRRNEKGSFQTMVITKDDFTRFRDQEPNIILKYRA